MGFLSGLHGVVAVVLLCSLLFVEEAGVPVPFAPGELTLIAAGLLIAAGGLDPFVFVPLAFAACVSGAAVGYSWARVVGERGLSSLAAKIHQEKALARVTVRIKSAGPVGIGVSRLIPGLRIYTTLVAGAVVVRRRTFFLGMIPATAIWILVFVILGAVAGIPVEHFFSKLERLAVQGAILLVMGVGGYLAIRRAPTDDRQPLIRLPSGLRIALAAAVDVAVVAAIISGILSVAGRITQGWAFSGWADGAAVAASVAVFYLILTIRGTGTTVGEALLHTSYVSRIRLKTIRTLGSSAGSGADSALAPAASLLQALGDVSRLEIVRAVLGGHQTVEEVGTATQMPAEQVEYHLAALVHAGVLSPATDPGPAASPSASYMLTEGLRGWLSDLVNPDSHPLLEVGRMAARART